MNLNNFYVKSWDKDNLSNNELIVIIINLIIDRGKDVFNDGRSPGMGGGGMDGMAQMCQPQFCCSSPT